MPLTTTEPGATLDALATGLAHEINNPLTYVMANLELLADRLRAGTIDTIDKEELHDLITESLEGADRIRRVVKQVQTAVLAGNPSAFPPVAG